MKINIDSVNLNARLKGRTEYFPVVEVFPETKQVRVQERVNVWNTVDYSFVEEWKLTSHALKVPTEEQPTQSIAPQDDKSKGLIKLYCVKDFTNWRGAKCLTKGETYTFDESGRTKFDDGYIPMKYSSYSEFCSENPCIAACLIRTEKRPAKLNEYVVITQDGDWNDKSYKKGDIYQVARISPSNSDRCYCVYNKTDEIFLDVVEYLVLPDYQPEKVAPTYLNMKVVCTDGSKYFVAGKVYEFVNGKLKDEDGDERPQPVNPTRGRVSSLEQFHNECSDRAKFIPYLGEQS